MKMMPMAWQDDFGWAKRDRAPQKKLGHPVNTRPPVGGETARLRNPKRAEALGGNAFSVVWVQCIQTTCGENTVKCRIME